MLNIIKNNKGMSLPIILAISSFFIISVFILTTVVLYQAKAREADFNYQQEYSLAQSKINATVNAIVNNDDLSTDFLNDLSDFLDVEITQYDSSTIMISSDLTSGRLVKSYLSKNSEAISTTDEYFENTGFEDDFELNPLITPASLLNSYLDQYFEENFDQILWNVKKYMPDANIVGISIQEMIKSKKNFNAHYMPNILEANYPGRIVSRISIVKSIRLRGLTFFL